jgi:MoxR-like ATPase
MNETTSSNADAINALREHINSRLVGQPQVVDQVLIALLAGGHLLIEGVPGLGKTLLVQTLAAGIGGQFKRIQFTPDLMPGDVTGHVMFDM